MAKAYYGPPDYSDPAATELLLKAAELLGEKGWCQGTSKDDEGRMCALGAMDEARYELYGLESYGGARASMAYRNGFWRLVAQIDASSPSSVPGWNDEPRRTAEDVILAFKKAAADG